MGDINSIPNYKEPLNPLTHKEPYSDPEFNEIRDLLYDAESHMEKGRNKTCLDILNIVSIRLGDKMFKLNV